VEGRISYIVTHLARTYRYVLWVEFPTEIRPRSRCRTVSRFDDRGEGETETPHNLQRPSVNITSTDHPGSDFLSPRQVFQADRVTNTKALTLWTRAISVFRKHASTEYSSAGRL